MMDSKGKTTYFTSPKSKKAFIEAVIRSILKKGPTGKKLQNVMMEISKFLQKESALADSNLHRKSYGNLKQLFHEEKFNGIFVIDKNVVILEKIEVLKKGGKIDSQLMTKIENAYAGIVL